MRTARKFLRSRRRAIIENNNSSSRDEEGKAPVLGLVVNCIYLHIRCGMGGLRRSEPRARASAHGRVVEHPALGKLLESFGAGMASRAVLEECLSRVAAEDGEGARAFTRVYASTARNQADAADALYRRGGAGPLAGVPVSVKDLFDVEGDTTTAGSRVLAHAPVANADAAIVSRLKRAGAVIVGRTNMTEFAYLRRRPEPALRHAEKSLRACLCADPRRIVFRRGGECFGWYGGCRRRHGYRWFGADPGRLVRPDGVQADGAPRADGRRSAAGAEPRFHRADWPYGGLLRTG